jgi:hypothetical protein
MSPSEITIIFVGLLSSKIENFFGVYDTGEILFSNTEVKVPSSNIAAGK